MKVGSLVECIDCSDFQGRLIILNKKTIYTVRRIRISPFNNKTTQVLLDEVINEYHKGNELGYGIFRFRELLPPMSITIEQFEHEKV